LGLAIVSKIAHDHYGSVAVEHTSETGTVFLVKFPRSQAGFADFAEIHESDHSPAS
jgi:signal transduction histidine kinase